MKDRLFFSSDSLICDINPKFRTCGQVHVLLQDACRVNSDIAEFRVIGTSEAGRDIDAAIIGTGDTTVSLIAGAHSDESVGPETLRTFIVESLKQRDHYAALFSQFKFIIVPHINPDGEARNQAWIKEWPDVESYIRHVFRELPGRDLEFGFPAMRTENKIVSEFLRKQGPYAFHMSLHGMGICDGAMLLIEKNWIAQTGDLRQAYGEDLKHAGFPLHDHDRKGDKGFQYIEPGFTTTPEGAAMQAYFRSQGDEKTASQFHQSSMEFVLSLGHAPLCLVTELPLFIIKKEGNVPQPGVPKAYLEFKKSLPELQAKLHKGESVAEHLATFKLEAADLKVMMKLQFRALELGLETLQKV